MDIESHSNSAFQPISPSFAVQIFKEPIIVEGYFAQTISASKNITLTLTKKHIIARNTSQHQIDQIYVAEINFDLKFQVLYLEEKNVHSKKLGLKFAISNQQSNSFYCSDTSLIDIWSFHLSKLINQKGFHELFKPIKKLGKGNFASVYQVERLTDLRRFAVKAFSKQNTFATKNGKESLVNQLTVMRNLNHSNVLRLQSVFESQNSIYVILEVLSGGQLFHKIQKNKGQFSKTEVKIFMKGLLSGLAHMHQNRIMHRDLKPQNIMLRDQNSMDPVIVDFGLATDSDLQKYLFYRCGTPGYVAPQIVALTENVHVEPQCDIFSAGVIFHIFLLRKPLFEGTKYDQVYRNNKQMNFNLSSGAYDKLQKNELELLKMMLKQKPLERITAAEALKHPFFNDLEIENLGKQISSPQLTSASGRPLMGRKIANF